MANGSRIRRMLGIDQADRYFVDYVYRTNANLGTYGGIAVAAVMVLLIVNALTVGRNVTTMSRLASYVVFGTVSLVLAAVSRLSVRTQNYRPMVFGTVAYLYVAAAYGVYNSYLDSLVGEPPLTFIFTMVAATCVFVTPPIGSIALNAIAFVAYNRLSNMAEVFSPSTVFHYWLGWIIVSFVAILRYQECRYGASHEESLREASSIDELTGLKNRRSLRSEFDLHLGRPLFVAMCDLDDFKGINDEFGHVAGDNVLRAFARVLREAFVGADCYRYGGDEFLVFMPDIAEEDFLACVDAVHVGMSREQVTASVGYAFGTPMSDLDLRAMIHIADAQLYEVKRTEKGGSSGEAFSGGQQARSV